MSDRTRIYLDHAATSWPKSQSVLHAMLDFAKNCGVAAGRGGYRSAVDAERIVTGVRKEIAKLIEASQSDTISFHANGTGLLMLQSMGLYAMVTMWLPPLRSTIAFCVHWIICLAKDGSSSRSFPSAQTVA